MSDDDLVDIVGQITATSDRIRQQTTSDAAEQVASTLAEVEVSAADPAKQVEVTIADSRITRLALAPRWLEVTDSFEVERVITATVNECLADYQAALAEAMAGPAAEMSGMFANLRSLDAKLDAAYDRAMRRIDAGEVLW